MQITENFWLHEFLRSQTAARHGIHMSPRAAICMNIERLCKTVLQPLRDDVGATIFISSGYRPYELNRLIGGSESSEHMNGNAADFVVAGMTCYDVCQRIRELGLEFDQLIHEFGDWIHVGLRDGELRGQELTAYRDQGQTRYVNGIVRMEDLT